MHYRRISANKSYVFLREMLGCHLEYLKQRKVGKRMLCLPMADSMNERYLIMVTRAPSKYACTAGYLLKMTYQAPTSPLLSIV